MAFKITRGGKTVYRTTNAFVALPAIGCIGLIFAIIGLGALSPFLVALAALKWLFS